MRVAVSFQNEQLDLEVPDDRLVADWHGPAGVSSDEVRGLVLKALETPRDYPALHQAVVPGDRVVIVFDAEISAPRPVLDALCHVLRGAGVEPGSITVLSSRAGLADPLPEGVARAVHDPDDRTQLAYLASTSEGRRIYLNRLLTDADVVIPVGLLGFDPVFGFRGPWSVIFPGLSDRETARSFRERTTGAIPDPDHPWPALIESSEVSWLLGSQFHLGLVEGVTGLAEVVAGLDTVVRDQGTRAVDRSWTFRAESRAELVVVGVGRPGLPAGIDDLGEALANATRLVQRGGKIVALSRVEGTIGPAMERLIQADDPRLGRAPLRGHEADPDFGAAQQLADALAWADVYLLSALDPEAVEDLSMIALDRPEETRRLVAASGSSLFVSQADRVRAIVEGDR